MKKQKKKKDWNKILFIALLILLALEISLIPCLIYAEVKGSLAISFFLVSPTIVGIAVLLLGRNCTNDYAKKRERLMQKIND